MPIIDRGPSNLTPTNARVSDVASNLVHSLMPLQHQKISAAFRVQGIPAILYNRLLSGRVCTCKGSHTKIAKLDHDGKADIGIINDILTGAAFGTSNYGDRIVAEDAANTTVDEPNAFEIMDISGTVRDPSETTLDDLVSEFDLGLTGYTDAACAICFGTGFVGGYAVYNGWRQVVVPTDMQTNCTVDPISFKLRPGDHAFTIVLPRGAVLVDAFRCWNGLELAPIQDLCIDTYPVTENGSLRFCDGRRHQVSFTCETEISHFELQYGLTNVPAFFEVPKMSQSADISLMETTEPFQIQMSPEVATIGTMDIITESQSGKALLVTAPNPWNTRDKSRLAWECQVRVTQPMELFRLLPRRKYRPLSPPTRPALRTRSVEPFTG